jgi:AcrR family transcriptional regulator
MTIDLVAARANAARATVYRRWATKADLAVDAVGHMSRGDAERAPIPDTGNLRDDLVAAIAPHSIEEQEFRIKVMGGLAALAGSEPRLAASAGLAPWVEVSRAILQRAVDRGEYPGVDITMIAQVVPMMCVCRVAVQQLPITREFSLSLIDDVILPAMRGSVSH